MAAIYRVVKSVTTSRKTNISKQKEENINTRLGAQICIAFLHLITVDPGKSGLPEAIS